MNTQSLQQTRRHVQMREEPQPQTPASVASAKAYQRAERSRLEALDIVFSDPDGSGALASLVRGGGLS